MTAPADTKTGPPERGSLPIRALAYYALAHWPRDTLHRNEIRELLPPGERRRIGGRVRSTVGEALREAIRQADRAKIVDRDGDLLRVRGRSELLAWALDIVYADEAHPQLVAIRRALEVAP
jgi:hypothetical protein